MRRWREESEKNSNFVKLEIASKIFGIILTAHIIWKRFKLP